MAGFQWSEIASPEYQGAPFPVTLTAKDVNGYSVSNYNGTATLSVMENTILGQPPATDHYNANSTVGYSFTPSINLEVTDILHYFGDKVSIWTDSGTLVASQTYAMQSPGWADTPLATPVELQAGVTYRIAAYAAGQTYYYRWDMPNSFPLGTIGQSYQGKGDLL